MSTGKLKAEFNRVRTSVALQANSMWTKVIGVEEDPQSGSNAAIEASLQAPSHTGRSRHARRKAARALIEEAGYEPTVTSFEGLLALARAQGNFTSGKRGVCRTCGGMGHTTKQCKNHLSTFYKKEDLEIRENTNIDSLPSVHESSEISSLSSETDSDADRRKRRKQKRKHHSYDKDSSIKHKKHDRSYKKQGPSSKRYRR